MELKLIPVHGLIMEKVTFAHQDIGNYKSHKRGGVVKLAPSRGQWPLNLDVAAACHSQHKSKFETKT